MSDNDNKAAGAVAAPEMEAFFTRRKANEGIKLPLWTPQGTKSEHWVRIMGVDSDEFRAANAESQRDALRIAQMDDKAEQARAIADSKRMLVAALVIDWSFDRPCTRESVAEFFLEAPQIMDSIDVAASRRALFFAHGSSSSEPTPSTSSAST